MKIACVLLLLAAEPAVETSPLHEYVAKADDTYRWEKRSEQEILGVQCIELKMHSQTWKGIEWKHLMCIARPPQRVTDEQAILLIGSSSWRDAYDQPADPNRLSRDRSLLALIANAAKMTVVTVDHIPFQPIFDRVEDEIIALTFKKFLETDDATWPLLLPMTKGAVRAMDTAQALVEEEFGDTLSSFTVTGASKRGWTTWLTAAVDPRVVAIAPMVFDVLKMKPQMDHQVATFGEFSEQIGDYTELNLQKSLDTPKGKVLTSIVDPISYVDRLQLPKVIILGTNDRYWPADALNLYWDDLNGDKYVLYVPNTGHSLKDPVRVVGTVAAMALNAAGRLTFPQLEWSVEENADSLVLTFKSDQKPISVSAWTTNGPSRDLRESRWEEVKLHANSDVYTYRVSRPDEGVSGLFGEAVFETNGHRYHLSTNLRPIGSDAVGE